MLYLLKNKTFGVFVVYDDISKKQIEILKFIKDTVALKGYPPAVREICEAVNLKSTSTVHGHLMKLEKKGYIKRDPTKPRAIEILEEENEMSIYNMNTEYIPLVGKITAGEPILAVENVEENFPVPKEFLSDGEFFMLKVSGESMIEAGIFDNDFVLIKKQNDAKNGDIVAAMVDDSATIKTFYKEKDRIRLQPENSTMNPIYSDNVSVLGIIKGVFRKM
jgi:repressor LexA